MLQAVVDPLVISIYQCLASIITVDLIDLLYSNSVSNNASKD